MFTVWSEGGVRTPYQPGHLSAKRVEKVPRVVRARRLETETEDDTPRASRGAGRLAADAYAPDHDSSLARRPAIRARQIMTSPVVTLAPTASFVEAWTLIMDRRFRHVPIATDQGRLVGILSDRDLFRATIDRETGMRQPLHTPDGQSIQTVMATQVLSASPDEEIRKIAQTLFEERIGAMPLVTEDDRLVGIVTRSDILHAVVHEAPFDLWI